MFLSFGQYKGIESIMCFSPEPYWYNTRGNKRLGRNEYVANNICKSIDRIRLNRCLNIIFLNLKEGSPLLVLTRPCQKNCIRIPS